MYVIPGLQQRDGRWRAPIWEFMGQLVNRIQQRTKNKVSNMMEDEG